LLAKQGEIRGRLATHEIPLLRRPNPPTWRLGLDLSSEPVASDGHARAAEAFTTIRTAAPDTQSGAIVAI
jgi:hypothetical protein